MNTKGIDGNLKTESLQRAVEFVPNIMRCTENRKLFNIQMYIHFSFKISSIISSFSSTPLSFLLSSDIPPELGSSSSPTLCKDPFKSVF